MQRPHSPRRQRSLAAVIGVLLLAAALRLVGIDALPQAGQEPARSPSTAPDPAPRRPADVGDAGAARLARAFAERESGLMLTVEGTVEKLLADDRDGSRHQRFLVRVAGFERTLLVAHNVDLAERAPLAPGTRLRLRGQYEWNERGGVLHWTHHDPDGRHPGGWLEVGGRRID